MRMSRPNLPVVLGTALVGAVLVLLLLPSTRQLVRRKAQAWWTDLQEEEGKTAEEIEQEAGATEGGLAGTRGWDPGIAV